MSTNQSSSIRVKTSKNPWNKKKNTKQSQLSNTNKPQHSTSASPRNVCHPSTIHTIHPLTNTQHPFTQDTEQWPGLTRTANDPNPNTNPSPPNIKASVPTPNPIRSNGHHPGTTQLTSPPPTKPLQTKSPSPSTGNTSIQSTPIAQTTTEEPTSTASSPKKKRKRKKKLKTNHNKSNAPSEDIESNKTTLNKTNPHHTAQPHHPPRNHPKPQPGSSVSIAPKPDANNPQQQSPKNGYTLSRVHHDVPQRNYNQNSYRRGHRGRRRGRGRGGYRNNDAYYDEDNDYHRGYRNKHHRGRFGANHNQATAPRHSRNRNNPHNNYNRNRNYNRHNNRNNTYNQNNNNNTAGMYDVNNTNLWPQQNMYMALPIVPMPPYGMPAAAATPALSPNKKNKDGPTEGEERKSDTTAATATSPTTATTPMMIPPIYTPYPALNMPYLFGQNMFGEPAMDSIHLMMNQMAQPPEWSGEVWLPAGPFYVLKVSCVATGPNADDRSVGHIALLDWNLKTKANIFVKPEQEIVSYIEPLTSLNAELLDKYGYPLEKAITIIKSELPSNAVIIGQNITMDIQWLGLKTNQDFKTFIDLRDVWRSWSEYYKSYTHYSLNHQAKCILNVENAHQQKHSASFDAITTMKLFQYYLYCRYYNMSLFHNKIMILQNTTIEPSFSKKHPVYEGVQMQSKRYKGVPYITAIAKTTTTAAAAPAPAAPAPATDPTTKTTTTTTTTTGNTIAKAVENDNTAVDTKNTDNDNTPAAVAVAVDAPPKTE
eukprot:130008_1